MLSNVELAIEFIEKEVLFGLARNVMNSSLLKSMIFALFLLLWAVSYFFLTYARLDTYEQFYNVKYSVMYNVLGIGEMALLYGAFTIVVLNMSFWSERCRLFFLVINAVMIYAVVACPIVTPFEFFLFKHRNDAENPFANCKSECALLFDPGTAQLGINDSSDTFIVYSSSDRFSSCVNIYHDKKCIILFQQLNIDKQYGIADGCDYTLKRLTSKNYYKLTTHKCS